MTKMDFEGDILISENGKEDNFYPFSITHSLWEIRTGALRHFEKVEALFPKKNLHFAGRVNHTRSFNARFGRSDQNLTPTGILVLDASLIANGKFFETIDGKLQSTVVFTNKDDIIAAYISPEDMSRDNNFLEKSFYYTLSDEKFSQFPKVELPEVIKLDYLWDTLDYNGEEVNNDSRYFVFHFEKLYLPQHHSVHAVNPGNIILGKNVKIAPGVVLDASQGKIILGNNVTIMPNSVIMGPCYVGDNSMIKIGAKIYGQCSFGEWCKVGGELENTIIHAYSNKQHEGFLGHSYIGEWVNFGADTNNSDLKNTYAAISMTLPSGTVDTGRIFLGLMCGDHTKTGINSMFTTGTVAGVCGILVKEWFLPNIIKSFSWGGKFNSPVYKFEKAIETTRIVMKRRNRELLEEEIILLEEEYKKVTAENS